MAQKHQRQEAGLETKFPECILHVDLDTSLTPVAKGFRKGTRGWGQQFIKIVGNQNRW